MLSQTPLTIKQPLAQVETPIELNGGQTITLWNLVLQQVVLTATFLHGREVLGLGK